MTGTVDECYVKCSVIYSHFSSITVLRSALQMPTSVIHVTAMPANGEFICFITFQLVNVRPRAVFTKETAFYCMYELLGDNFVWWHPLG